MSVNISNQNYYNQQGNFGAIPEEIKPENTLAGSMLKSMELPTNPKECKEFVPYLGAGIGFSFLVSKIANLITKANLNKNPNFSVSDSFEQSKLSRFSAKIDEKVLPIIQKNSSKIQQIKNFIQQKTPQYIKDAVEKIKIGVEPKCGFAKSTYLGLTKQSVDFFFESANNLGLDELKRLGIQDLVAQAAKATNEE